MNDICSYRIDLRGQLDENEISPASPLQMTVQQIEVGKAHPSVGRPPAAVTRLRICTDQAGLIGLLRYLHGKGFVIEAMLRDEEAS